MTSRNFEDWLKSFTDNINNWNYYVNYDTAYKNTASVKRQLALLNTLKGSENIEDESIAFIFNEADKIIQKPIYTKV